MVSSWYMPLSPLNNCGQSPDYTVALLDILHHAHVGSLERLQEVDRIVVRVGVHVFQFWSRSRSPTRLGAKLTKLYLPICNHNHNHHVTIVPVPVNHHPSMRERFYEGAERQLLSNAIIIVS